jgi:nucleotide-binding universal stress UspA family protein
MKILLAIDGSEYSETAMESVAARPWPSGTKVRVLCVIDKVKLAAPEMWVYAGNLLELEQQQLTQEAERLTARVANSLEAKGLSTEAVVRLGDPRAVIVDEAKEWGADLIVVGSHGRRGITRWLLGSVAQSVASHASCSVEVIRRKLPEAA